MSDTAANTSTGTDYEHLKAERSRLQTEEQSFRVYKPSTSAVPAPFLPDSYFTPTATDLKAAQAALSARTQSLVNAPLQLRGAREAIDKIKRERWPNTTIRVKFTDRTQLEKVFPSTDKLRSIYAFVRCSLREDTKSVKFILYQSPPKRDLKVSDPKVRDLTLAELNLAPSSVLLLRFENEILNGSDVPAPLAPAMLAQAVDLPSPPDYDTYPAADQPSSSSGSSARQKTAVKIPKWLKMKK